MRLHSFDKKKRILLISVLIVICLLLGIGIVAIVHMLSSKDAEEITEPTEITKEEKSISYDDDISKQQITYFESFLDTSIRDEFDSRIQNRRKSDHGLTVESVIDVLIDCSAEQQVQICRKTFDIIDAELDAEIIIRTWDDTASPFISSLSVQEDFYEFCEEPKAGDKVTALVCGDQLIWICDTDSTGIELSKAFIYDNQPDFILVEYEGSEYRYENKTDSYNGYLNVADIILSDGKVIDIDPYLSKVNGRLLSVRKEEENYRFELEDNIYESMDTDVPVYRLFGDIGKTDLSDLVIGYDFTDFVLDDENHVIAALMTKQEDMRKIRVVVKTDEYEDVYHTKLELSCDSDMTIRSGQSENRIEAGEHVIIDMDSDLFVSDRLVIKPSVHTARISCISLNRAQGNPSYRGVIEVERTKSGLLFINELSLDEYLYSVVPSEMPSSYPTEALKAQAVSARTYAYMHMMHAGMARYGAHVDDSAAFQVYNNCQETLSTTEAVNATSNEILTYDGKPVTTYFYSTSCGYGTDLLAWKYRENQYSDSDMKYLQSREISQDGINHDIIEVSSMNAESDEEAFDKWIRSFPSDYFESDESYFRWSYVTDFDLGLFYQTLKTRYEANKEAVLTLTDQGYESKDIKETGDVLSMEITARAPGGAACELYIETEHGEYKVITEKNIRYLLAGANTSIRLGNGYEKEGKVRGMLPSAFCVIEPTYDEERLVSYHIYGGGFGHGIGMSQNGAKNMALQGLFYTDILGASYQNTTLETLEGKGEEE